MNIGQGDLSAHRKFSSFDDVTNEGHAAIVKWLDQIGLSTEFKQVFGVCAQI
jgi:hypothetical protein